MEEGFFFLNRESLRGARDAHICGDGSRLDRIRDSFTTMEEATTNPKDSTIYPSPDLAHVQNHDVELAFDDEHSFGYLSDMGESMISFSHEMRPEGRAYPEEQNPFYSKSKLEQPGQVCKHSDKEAKTNQSDAKEETRRTRPDFKQDVDVKALEVEILSSSRQLPCGLKIALCMSFAVLVLASVCILVVSILRHSDTLQEGNSEIMFNETTGSFYDSDAMNSLKQQEANFSGDVFAMSTTEGNG